MHEVHHWGSQYYITVLMPASWLVSLQGCALHNQEVLAVAIRGKCRPARAVPVGPASRPSLTLCQPRHCRSGLAASHPIPVWEGRSLFWGLSEGVLVDPQMGWSGSCSTGHHHCLCKHQPGTDQGVAFCIMRAWEQLPSLAISCILAGQKTARSAAAPASMLRPQCRSRYIS